jgi:hypothetical protein
MRVRILEADARTQHFSHYSNSLPAFGHANAAGSNRRPIDLGGGFWIHFFVVASRPPLIAYQLTRCRRSGDGSNQPAGP